jgi:hypothetical protein
MLVIVFVRPVSVNVLLIMNPMWAVSQHIKQTNYGYIGEHDQWVLKHKYHYTIKE